MSAGTVWLLAVVLACAVIGQGVRAEEVEYDDDRLMLHSDTDDHTEYKHPPVGEDDEVPLSLATPQQLV